MSVKEVLNQSMIDLISVEKFYKQREKYNFAISLQRGVVWDDYLKSNLINSLLINIPVPLILVNRKPNGILNVMDGVNRSSSIISFINNEFAIANDVSDVELTDLQGNKKIYHLAGKKFEDFETELKNRLLNSIIKVEVCDNLDEETEKEIMLRQNSGVSMSGIAKARIMAYEDIQPFVFKIAKNEFFDRKVNISNTLKASFSHERIIYSLIAYECDIKDVSYENSKRIVEIIKEKDLFTPSVEKEVETTINYLNASFPAKHKILGSLNIFSIYVVAKQAIEDNIQPRDFYAILDMFYNDKEMSKMFSDKHLNKHNITTYSKKIKMIMDYYKEAIKIG